MSKRAASLLLGLLLLAGTSLPALADAPAEAAGPGESNPAYAVFINDQQGPSAELTSGSAYVPLCATALAMRPDAAADFQNQQATIHADDFDLSAQSGAGYLEVNGRYLYIPAGVLPDKTGTDLLVPADTLVYALGAMAVRDDDALTVQITVPDGARPLISGDDYYDPAQVDLMARIIRHESGYEPLAGQIAVGNVLQNRVASPIFPNTLAEVVAQPGQFPGATSLPPSASSTIAAKLCLDGAVVVSDACWFNQKGLTCWASRHKTLAATIGGHDFYA